MRKLISILTLMLLAVVCFGSDRINVDVWEQDFTGVTTRLNVTITPVSPLPRVYYTNVFSMAPITRITDATGHYLFTNVLWGNYTLTIQGNPPSVYGFQIGTNLSGTVNVGALITNAAAVPPNPATNYYTQAQIDAKLAGISGGGTDANALHATNNLSDVQNAATSRANLGLGTAAVANTGTLTTGTVPYFQAGGIMEVDGTVYLPSGATLSMSPGSSFTFGGGNGFLEAASGTVGLSNPTNLSGFGISLPTGDIFIGDASFNSVARAMSGDVTINSTGVTALKSTGTAGTYAQTTFDAQGRETSGSPTLPWSSVASTPTTIAGYGITSPLPVAQGGTAGTTVVGAITALGGPYQPTNANLTAQAAGNASSLLGSTSTTALAGNTTASSIGGIASVNGIGTGTTISSGIFGGNAQGGSITNLDASIFNVKDYGNSVTVPWSSFTNLGGVLYVPGQSTFSFSAPLTVPGNGAGDGDSSAYTIRGNGSGTSKLSWNGANSIAISMPQNNGLQLDHFDFFNGGTGTNTGYYSAWGGNKSLRWDDVIFNGWLVGAEPSQSGADISALQLRFNGVGLWLPLQSDADFINVAFSIDNTNAAIYADSNGHHIQYNGAGDNIGVLFDRGGGSALSGSAESITNTFAAYGDPSNLPSWFTNNANNAGMQGLVIENGYLIGGGVTNSNSQGYPSLLKIYNNSADSVIAIRNFDVTSADVVVFRTNTDSTQPITFDGVTMNGSNAADFSDGTFLTAAAASAAARGHVGLNTPEQQFTKSTLEYGRDTSGDIYVNGIITNNGGFQGTTIGPQTAGNPIIIGKGASANNYGIQMGDAFNSGVSFAPQISFTTFGTANALPLIVWAGNLNWIGNGPANLTDNTVRFGRAAAPQNGASSAWGPLGATDVPFIFDGHVMSDVYMSAPMLIATNGIVTKGTSSGTITATGWTNSTGTNCNVWPFGTAVSYILFDNAGNPIVTNVTISTTDAHAEPVQAGGKLTAASGLSGVWHVQ